MGILDFLFGKKSSPTKTNSPPQKRIHTDWSTSEPHLLLLSSFIKPHRAESFRDDWQNILGESPSKVIERLFAEGVLVDAPVEDKLDGNFKVTDLKQLLKDRGQPFSGKKEDLVNRLLSVDPAGMEKLTSSIRIMQCSDAAKPLIQAFIDRRNAQRQAAVDESLSLLQGREYEKASQAMARYEAQQIFPRGLGMNWKNHDTEADALVLRGLFESKPKILSGLAEQDWESLRIAAGMMHLWGARSGKEWLPEGFKGVDRFDIETSIRMLMFHGYNRRDIARFKRIGIKRATVRGCGAESCTACQKIADKTMPIDNLPELPYEACTCEVGCRCYLEADIDSALK